MAVSVPLIDLLEHCQLQRAWADGRSVAEAGVVTLGGFDVLVQAFHTQGNRHRSEWFRPESHGPSAVVCAQRFVRLPLEQCRTTVCRFGGGKEVWHAVHANGAAAGGTECRPGGHLLACG